MKALALPNDPKYLLPILVELLRRAVDGTVPPLFVDYDNQRIIFGGTTISASPATVEIATGDIKIVSSGSGIILPNRAGTLYYRLLMENDGAIAADPI